MMKSHFLPRLQRKAAADIKGDWMHLVDLVNRYIFCGFLFVLYTG